MCCRTKEKNWHRHRRTMVYGVIRSVQAALKYRGGWKGLLEHMYTVSPPIFALGGGCGRRRNSWCWPSPSFQSWRWMKTSLSVEVDCTLVMDGYANQTDYPNGLELNLFWGRCIISPLESGSSSLRALHLATTVFLMPSIRRKQKQKIHSCFSRISDWHVGTWPLSKHCSFRFGGNPFSIAINCCAIFRQNNTHLIIHFPFYALSLPRMEIIPSNSAPTWAVSRTSGRPWIKCGAIKIV